MWKWENIFKFETNTEWMDERTSKWSQDFKFLKKLFIGVMQFLFLKRKENFFCDLCCTKTCLYCYNKYLWVFHIRRRRNKTSSHTMAETILPFYIYSTHIFITNNKFIDFPEFTKKFNISVCVCVCTENGMYLPKHSLAA